MHAEPQGGFDFIVRTGIDPDADGPLRIEGTRVTHSRPRRDLAEDDDLTVSRDDLPATQRG
jgi:hypothetical protein